MPQKQLPTLRRFLVIQVLVTLAIAAAIFSVIGYFYLSSLQRKEEGARLQATLDAYSRTIKPDLQLGDFWAIRRTLGAAVDTGLLSFVKVNESSSNEEIVSLPFRPKGWGDEKAYSSLTRTVSIKSNDGLRSWTIEGALPLDSNSKFFLYYSFTYVGLVMTFLLTIGALFWRVNKKLTADIQIMVSCIGQINPDSEVNTHDFAPNIAETEGIVKKTSSVSKILVASVASERELAVHAALGELASQVAHDIRSPLAALNATLEILKSFPEDERTLIRSAIVRISDIANNLLRKKRYVTHFDSTKTVNANKADKTASRELLPLLIESIASEKRSQRKGERALNIETDFDRKSQQAFVEVEQSVFKRVLSNLIDNSIEAISDVGTVKVSLTSDDETVLLQVTDSGKGIPPNLIPNLAKKGFSFGKPEGNGLGLFYAKSSVETWGGDFNISSKEGLGTTVSLRLIQKTAPDWFASEIKILSSTVVVTLDDDASIHQIWKSRFQRLKPRGPIPINFLNAAELQRWHEENRDLLNVLYLCDYELIGSTLTGLELIKSLKIEKASILVTSRYDDPDVRRDASSLGIQIIPKAFAPFVEITIKDGKA